MKVSTVNVIEQAETIFAVRSFSDDTEGNQEAEEVFKACMLENGGSEDDVEAAIEDGYFEKGTYTLSLAHSS